MTINYNRESNICTAAKAGDGISTEAGDGIAEARMMSRDDEKDRNDGKHLWDYRLVY
jgi:hypothetical protein